MDSVTTSTPPVSIVKRSGKSPGDTAKIYAQLEQEEEIHEKTRVNEEKRRAQIETFCESLPGPGDQGLGRSVPCQDAGKDAEERASLSHRQSRLCLSLCAV